MNEALKKNELFQTSHIMILVCYTIFSVTLIVEASLLGWESWALMLVFAGIVTAWLIHTRQVLSEYSRLWIYSGLMMATFFYYGIHPSSLYDLCPVMTAIIMLYTMTGVSKLILLCQCTFFITFTFDLAALIRSGAVWDKLRVTQIFLHVALILTTGWIARVIIDRWGRVLGKAGRLIEELTASTARQNDFLANVSHELRTPVNAVLGFTGACLEKEGNAAIKQDMERVLEAGARIGDQISDILDYSEIDRRSLSNSLEDYMPSSVVNDVMALISPMVAPGIELVVDVDPHVPAVLHSDAAKLRKILLHLMENALKYTRTGGVYVRIDTMDEEYGANLRIKVEDTGIGMAEGEPDKAILGVYQGDSSRTRSSGGLGLGLAIVSGFVKSLGGFLTIRSRLGTGTRIRVCIPQKVVDHAGCMSITDAENRCLGAYINLGKFSHPDVREYYGRLMKTITDGLDVRIHRVESLSDLKKLCSSITLTHLLVGKEEYQEDPAFMRALSKHTLVVVAADQTFVPEGRGILLMPKPVTGFMVAKMLNMQPGAVEEKTYRIRFPQIRALVVDDEPMNLSVASRILERYGMIIETASSGYDAVEACENNTYDIVFMDHMMPGMDGVEAAERIREYTKRTRSHISIVALTANAVSTAKEMFLSKGFDGFIAKPIEINELERVLRRVISEDKTEYLAEDSDAPEAAGAAAAPENTPEAAGAAAAPKTADHTNILESAGIDQKQGLASVQGDLEFYHSLLVQFAAEEPEKAGRLQDALETGDDKTYEIFVHALKSTAKLIGAASLSERAKALEDAASAHSIPKDAHEQLLVMYRRVADAIRAELCPQPDTTDTGQPEVLEFDAEPDVLEFDAAPEVLEFNADPEEMEFEAYQENHPDD